MPFSAAAFKAMHAKWAVSDGVTVTIRLSDGAGGWTDYDDVRAFQSGVSPRELVEGGPIKLGDVNLIILADDLPDDIRPLERKDRIVLPDGKIYAVEQWDDKTGRIGNIIVSYKVRVRA